MTRFKHGDFCLERWYYHNKFRMQTGPINSARHNPIRGALMNATIDQIEQLFIQLPPEEQATVLKRLTVGTPSNATPDATPTTPRRDPSWDRLFEIGAKIAAADRGGPSATEDLTSGRR